MHTFHSIPDPIDRPPLPPGACYAFEPSTETTVRTNARSLLDVCAAFEDYLRGCGFQFDGKLAIVPDDEDDLP